MTEAVMSKIQLWFFRDLSETQRKSLFHMLGISGVEVRTQMGQQKALHNILKEK